MIHAKISDLQKPEFVAFNRGRNYPVMRRWELPFVISRGRFGQASAVLDYTINPLDFGKRLSTLYPGLHYVHCSAVQNGQLALPSQTPVQSYDRIVCVNTLEHLLQSQRRELIADAVQRLKPGGLLFITSDYYFDEFWTWPHLWNAGVMREDRAELMNGWNKVTPLEIDALCREHGLEALDAQCTEPDPADTALYRNIPSYPHACIAGVYRKPPAEPSHSGRTVVLSLLTWNTRQITLDSVNAYIHEARMLRRMGHDAMICVCDNGSNDGTGESLEELRVRADVPIHILRNDRNAGSSVARNQIIDFLLASGADYLVFMDGDIEVIPFSTYAMLRHMESRGKELGCIGANSAGQSPYRHRATQGLFSVREFTVAPIEVIVWTQYGMFRREVFEAGVRFDESGPFAGPGWGYEDNDLAFQMLVKGFQTERFIGATYLHRAMRSSVRNLRQAGIDPRPGCEARKSFVLRKWAGVQQVDPGLLEAIRNTRTNI